MSAQMMIDPNDLMIRAQDTPNPNAIKFVVNVPLKRDGKATFVPGDAYAQLPLVHSLFDIPGVSQVYFFQNTLTVTHTGELPPAIVTEQVKSVLKTRINVHDPQFVGPDEVETKKAKPDRSHLSEDVQKIEEILDRTIRPGLQADGGDVEVMSYEDKTLRILYQGACGGCPSAMMGTLDAIQHIVGGELGEPELRVIPI